MIFGRDALLRSDDKKRDSYAAPGLPSTSTNAQDEDRHTSS